MPASCPRGSSLAAAAWGGCGARRDLHGLVGASTPAYFTVWNRGGGTLVASRQLDGGAEPDPGKRQGAMTQVAPTRPGASRPLTSCASRCPRDRPRLPIG